MLDIFKTDKKSEAQQNLDNVQVVKQIHKEFFSEVTILLENAKKSHSLETDYQDLINKSQQLRKLGFNNTKEVVEADKEIKRYLFNYFSYITESADEVNELEREAGKGFAGERFQMKDPFDIKDFIFAGKAIFTIESTVTNNWYTYRVSVCVDRKTKEKKEDLFFVAVLRGSDNIHSYTYMGKVNRIRKPDKTNEYIFALTQASKFKADATCVKAFQFFLNKLNNNTVEPRINFYHMGICGRCGKALTVPESISRGLGPHCDKVRKAEEEARINRDASKFGLTFEVGEFMLTTNVDNPEEHKRNKEAGKFGLI